MSALKKIVLSLMILILLGYFGFKYSRDFDAPNVTFTTIEGKKIRIAELKGKVVLVNFWATECRACIAEMPALVNIYNTYKPKGFEVIAVAMPYDPPAQVLNYATQKKLPFPVMMDGLGEIVVQFNDVSVTPTTYVYNKQGKLIQYTKGAINFRDLRKLLDKEFS